MHLSYDCLSGMGKDLPERVSVEIMQIWSLSTVTESIIRASDVPLGIDLAWI